MNGFYNLIKPIGFTSGDLVVKLRGILRRHLGEKCKVGHLGTLDPLATGVLGIAVGSATKLFDYFLTKKKTYVATCVLGRTTDTLDSAGVVTEERECLGVTREAFEEAMNRFVGEIEQLPPVYSAKSVGGVKAYRLARKGKDPELIPCKVTIYEMEYLGSPEKNVHSFRVVCSGGTYIRSLCRDIGDALGYPAYMGSLIREQNGDMKIEDAVEWQDVEKEISTGFTSLEQYSKLLNQSDFSEEMRKKIENGVPMKTDIVDGLTAVHIGGKFYAIGEVKNGDLRIVARNL